HTVPPLVDAMRCGRGQRVLERAHRGAESGPSRPHPFDDFGHGVGDARARSCGVETAGPGHRRPPRGDEGDGTPQKTERTDGLVRPNPVRARVTAAPASPATRTARGSPTRGRAAAHRPTD